MAKQRKTSKGVARVASSLLRRKTASTKVKKVAGSALSQRAPKNKRKG